MSLMRKMWFGTKQFSRWIKVQSPDSAPTMAGSSERLDFGNGGVALRGSLNGHMEYALVWNRLTGREAREISDFAYGMFGDGPFYLSEPSSTGQNVLNKAWSAPGLTAKDGIPLAGEKRPEIVKNMDQSQGYPTDMARYVVGSSTPRRTFYVPIPPGHTAWVGAHGDPASAGGLMVQPTVRGIATGAASRLSVLGVSTPQRFNASFASSSDQSGLELSLEAGVAVVNAFTNPSFEAAGPTVECRRNLTSNPLTGASVDLMSVTRGTVATVSGGARFTVSDATAADAAQRFGQVSGNAIAVTPGQIISVSLDVGVSSRAAQAFVAQAFFQDASNVLVGSVVRSDTVTPATGGYSRAVIENLTVPAGAAKIAWEVGIAGAGVRAVGDTFVARNVLVEQATRALPFFFGGGASPDPDMTTAWVGAANASPSTLNAVSIPGATVARGHLVRSRRWAKAGSYSMRLIPSYQGTETQNAAAVIAGMPTSATHIITSYLPDALTGDGLDMAGVMLRNQGAAPRAFDRRPNQAGEYEHRFITEGATGNLELWGARFGGGDIWFDMLTVAAGTYVGPAFTGDTPGAVWNGTPQASTSTLSGLECTLAGIMVAVLPTGVTPENGPFVSGQGAGGLEFEGRVAPVPYSLAHDAYGLAVKLVETEDWK